MTRSMTRFLLAAPFLALAAGGCMSDKPPTELSQEAVCLQHFENDPVERDRCRQSAATRNDTVPDVRPQDLPIRTGEIER
ncbi:MAG: hypothetical protein Q8R02_23680 [Hyphomonadaceae bacterium]|nr:hypothetical protein [Hyphomonadaceae bacterium]